MASLKTTITAGDVRVELSTGIFYNNEFHPSIEGKTFKTVNPATEEEIATIQEGGEKDIDAAVSSAKKALRGPWGTIHPRDRGTLLYKLATLLDEDRKTFASLESLDTGKPLFESLNFDMTQAVNAYRYFAGYSDKFHGKSIPVNHDSTCFTTHEPFGVVGLIVPWNFPMQLLSWKLAPALATGNTVVIKPAELTPLTTLYLAQKIKEAGFPPGVVNVVPGYGHIAGSALAKHMDVSKIGFTGSTRVARLIQDYAAKSNLKATSLELGGKSPLIVFDDAPNLDAAVEDCYHALFWNSGQCCSAASRIFVQDTIYDQFVSKMLEKVRSRVLGSPFAADTLQGPVVSDQQFQTILRYIDTGVKEGAKLEIGGKRHGEKGFFIQPTVFSQVQDSMTIAREEIFGPVMCLLKFSSVEEVIERANNSNYGLVAAVYTRDVTKSLAVSKRLQSGLVWVNTYNVIESSVPWGGVKESGHGRDLSEYALSQYTVPKTVVIQHKL